MKRIFKKTKPDTKSGHIEFVNLSEFTDSIPLPNRNVNPSSPAIILMADEEGGGGGGGGGADDNKVVAIHTPIKLKKFTGHWKDGVDIEDWLKDFKQAAEANQWKTEVQKVTHLKANLDGLALSWFRAKFDGPNDIFDSADVYDALQTQFGAARPALKYLREIQALKQADDQPIQDYYCQMILLLTRANIALESQTAIDYVIAGLKPDLARRVYGNSDKYNNCDELFAKLKILDEATRSTQRQEDDLITMAREEPVPRKESLDPRNDEQSGGPGSNDQRSHEGWQRRGSGRSYGQSNRSFPSNRRAEALRSYPRDGGNRRPSPPPRRVRWQDEDNSRCWTCGSSMHWSYDCPHGQHADQRMSQGNETRGPANRTSGPPVPPRNRQSSSGSRDNHRSSTSN